MIKFDALEEFMQTAKIKDQDTLIDLETIKEGIMAKSDELQIPVSIEEDQVKSGGLLSKKIEDCLVVFHPEHRKDYFKFCIRLERQGIFAFVSAHSFGTSKQMKKAHVAEATKADRAGRTMSYKVGSLATSGLMTIGKSKKKLEEETRYYDSLTTIFNEVNLVGSKGYVSSDM